MEEFPSVQVVVDNGGNININKRKGRWRRGGGGGGAFPFDCRSQLILQCTNEKAKKIGIIKIICGHEEHY